MKQLLDMGVPLWHIGAMSTLPRLNVSLSEPLLAWLRAEAARLGLSVGSVVRMTLEQARTDAEGQARLAAQAARHVAAYKKVKGL